MRYIQISKLIIQAARDGPQTPTRFFQEEEGEQTIETQVSQQHGTLDHLQGWTSYLSIRSFDTKLVQIRH